LNPIADAKCDTVYVPVGSETKDLVAHIEKWIAANSNISNYIDDKKSKFIYVEDILEELKRMKGSNAGKKEHVAGEYPFTFEYGRLAVSDSGRVKATVNKEWVVPAGWVSKLDRCEKFILKHRRDVISPAIMDTANVYYEQYLKKLGMIVVDEKITHAKVGHRFIIAEPFEEIESRCLAKAFYGGKEYAEYINYENVINEIFDGKLQNAIVVNREDE
jgi:hypothetical protein